MGGLLRLGLDVCELEMVDGDYFYDEHRRRLS